MSSLTVYQEIHFVEYAGKISGPAKKRHDSRHFIYRKYMYNVGQNFEKNVIGFNEIFKILVSIVLTI